MSQPIDHVNVKIMARPGAAVEWHELIPVFHRWIQDRALPELLIDVADYAHVPNGPGVMLIGHEAFYSLDNRAGQVGLLYNRRTALEGSAAEKVEQAYAAAVAAAERLAAEPEFAGKLSFEVRDCEVFVNDRLLAPNTRETFETLAPEITGVLSTKWGSGVKLEWDDAPRGLFRVRATAE